VPGDQVETVMRTFDRVARTATAILDRLDTVQIGNGLPPGLDREAHARERAPGHPASTTERGDDHQREVVAR